MPANKISKGNMFADKGIVRIIYTFLECSHWLGTPGCKRSAGTGEASARQLDAAFDRIIDSSRAILPRLSAKVWVWTEY